MSDCALIAWVAACSALLPLPAAADDESAGRNPSAYRLNVNQPSTFRFVPADSYVPARKEPEIPARFADRPYALQIQRAAREASLDPALVHAVIHVESGYNAAARSPKGAIGLMQVLPETAARNGVPDPARSPEANLKAGTRYLRELMQQFSGRLDLVLAAYNAGENAVVRYGERIPPYRETQLYVPAVLSKYKEWRDPPAPTPSRIEYIPGTRLGSQNQDR
jgi:soluble lytic murein transglycosylase-like protein